MKINTNPRKPARAHPVGGPIVAAGAAGDMGVGVTQRNRPSSIVEKYKTEAKDIIAQSKQSSEVTNG